MPAFRILELNQFQEDYSQLPRTEQERVQRFILQLAENAAWVGKPLGFTYLREKKFDGNRL
ncbi:MAG: hypothetical protein AABY11_00145, partial [archaeon]